MKTIAICNQKGGVAKTTTTEMLALALTKQGKKVLVIDCDSQGSLTISLGLRDKLSQGLPELCNEMTVGEGNIESFDHSRIVATRLGVDVIRSNIRLSRSEINMESAINKYYVLRDIVKFYKDQYDYILLDTEPHLGTMLINAFVAADSVIIPTEPDFLSVEGMNILFEDMAKVKQHLNPELKIEGVLITKVQKSSRESMGYVKGIREAYMGRVNVFDFYIPVSEKVKVAIRKGEDLFEISPRSFATKAYLKLAEVIVNG